MKIPANNADSKIPENSKTPETHVWTNTEKSFGWISILFHWIMGLALIGMYFLGDYMVGLEYYDTWYHKAPDLHKQTGMFLGFLLILRVIWNQTQTKPQPLETKAIRVTLAKLAHTLLYLLTALLIISGYLISTAEGHGIDILGWFEFPALLTDSAQRGELAGKVHALAGTVFILTVGLHVVAALMHHFLLKDNTLKRMLWVRNKE